MFGYFRLPSSAFKPQQSPLSRLFVVLAGAALAVSAAIISIGCDSSSTFLPPPPDGLRGSAAEDLGQHAGPAGSRKHRLRRPFGRNDPGPPRSQRDQ